MNRYGDLSGWHTSVLCNGVACEWNMFQAKINGKWRVLQWLYPLWENISECRWTCLEVDWFQHGTWPHLVMQYSYSPSKTKSPHRTWGDAEHAVSKTNYVQVSFTQQLNSVFSIVHWSIKEAVNITPWETDLPIHLHWMNFWPLFHI